MKFFFVGNIDSKGDDTFVVKKVNDQFWFEVVFNELQVVRLVDGAKKSFRQNKC